MHRHNATHCFIASILFGTLVACAGGVQVPARVTADDSEKIVRVDTSSLAEDPSSTPEIINDLEAASSIASKDAASEAWHDNQRLSIENLPRALDSGDDKQAMLTERDIFDLLNNEHMQLSRTCTGPWIYKSYDCYNEGTGFPCGVTIRAETTSVPDYLPCARKEFGLASYREQAETEWPDTIYEQELYISKVEDADRAVYSDENKRHVLDICKQNITQIFSNWAEHPDWQVECGAIYATSLESKRRANYSRNSPQAIQVNVKWRAKFRYLEPVYNTRDNDPACPKIGEHDVETLTPHHDICRHELFGREKSNMCGAAERLVISHAGAAQKNLPSELFSWRAQGTNDAVCSTDDIAAMTSESLASHKLTRLSKNLVTLRKNLNIDSLRWHDEVQKRARLVFEVTAREETSPESVLALYTPYEVALDAPISISDKRMAHQTLCRALVKQHVHPARLIQAFAGCLALARPQTAELPGADLLEQRQIAINVATQMYGAFVRSIPNELTVAAQLIGSYTPLPTIETVAAQETIAQNLANQLTIMEAISLPEAQLAEITKRVALRASYLAQRIDQINDAFARHPEGLTHIDF